MIPRPGEQDVAPYFFTYIDQVPGDDPAGVLRPQLNDALELFAGISEEQSLRRYADGKWSIRQLLNHVTDTERAFAFRMLWFSRGFETPLPGYDQDIAAAGAEADGAPWAAHVEEFHTVRLSTVALYRNMPAAGWKRSGIASGKFVTVGALAYIVPGHVAHHLKVLRERYL
ncbi:MAG TPA: DinB family protein [Bryobacteraceae bacterium]|nr:DinB family protein [Bryobacteraceae bacterium]